MKIPRRRSYPGIIVVFFIELGKTEKISRILIHPDNPDVVFVAALGATWGDSQERGVFKSMDDGKTWKKVLYVNEKTGAADLAMDPSNPHRMLVAIR
ncbi:MAG: hypothetical protein FJY81_06470 [Candidatus Aminicenantes bacterium]|nr:hypothetical protein [Candidatus Aminicenantes bacterium]